MRAGDGDDEFIIAARQQVIFAVERRSARPRLAVASTGNLGELGV